MTSQAQINNDHLALESYLMNRFGGDADKVSAYMRVLEVELPKLLTGNGNFSSAYQSIYDLQDGKEIEILRSQIKSKLISKIKDMESNPRYTEALRVYRLFWKSRSQDKSPLPVPGEEKSAVGKAKPPVEQKTIFLEGVEAESQPEEYRIRNRQLREACIEHFKTLHNGRSVCECCGFDFAIAYDIEDDYIEVHHRFPFSHTEGEHPVNAETDLVPLCANCHRMIHHNMGGNGNCMSLEELKKKYRGKIYKG